MSEIITASACTIVQGVVNVGLNCSWCCVCVTCGVTHVFFFVCFLFLLRLRPGAPPLRSLVIKTSHVKLLTYFTENP